MAVDHRPEFKAMAELWEGKRADDSHRDAMLMPYINQKDLAGKHNIPRFIASRSHHHPAEFLEIDLEAMGVGLLHPRVVTIQDVRNVYLMFDKHNNTKEYAEFMPRSLDTPHTLITHPGLGLLLLEAQARTMSLLVACTKLILHDLDLSENALAQSLPQPALNLPKASDLAPSSLTDAIAEAPYLPPQRGSFTELASLLAAKREEVFDHLWSLREDPWYFATNMAELKEYHEVGLAARRHKCSIELNDEDKLTDEEKHVVELFLDVVGDAYCRVEEYSVLHAQVETLCQMEEQCTRHGKLGEDVSKAYTEAILIFVYSAAHTTKRHCQELGRILPASPALRRRSHRMKKLLDGKYSGKPVGSSKLTRADKDWIRLCNALEILSRDGLDMNTVGATTLVDELQGYIDSKARPELLMSPPIASCISDMAINGECLRLGSHHPWRLWAPSLKSLTGGQVTQAPKTQAVFLGLWRSLISNAGPILQRYAPFRTKLSYPIAKKITKENTEAVRKTESILDDFWRVFDQATVEARKDTAVGKILATPRLLYRTSPWVEPASKPQRPQTVIFPSLAFDASGPQDSTRNAPIKGSPAPTEKPKKKTRGVAAPRELELNENHQAEDAPRMDRAPFKVNKRALKAFEVIFLTHSTDSRPGEIAWKEFLYAMGAIGFAPRKLMGSMWQFDPDPTKLGVERGIQLHEPHPSDKIQYLQARHHGRRLNRAYGWDSDMFALVEESNWIGEGLMA